MAPAEVRVASRYVSLAIWAFAVWVLLTWSPFTVETEVFGGALSVVVSAALGSLGGVARPWLLLDPRRLAALGSLFVRMLTSIVAANVKLAVRIWTPSLPLRSGMVIVPTHERGDGGLAAVGLITSLVVDNQIVDLDRGRHLLQYHAVVVPEGGREAARALINGPLERLLAPLTGGDRNPDD